ncbi:contractile injection system protein, VgrG/Pvc8 family [Sphingomonas sp. AR_OL41]|uniref:phage baseplate assembly protein n=1 Tax=Sphingomonas sp. AR_OL41 TaxID=3042729 RepID=UPI0024802726|nr:contractile injection system protein, VgrG/Pvc8 family [Sphingomonas sp. AR_OL41]MDH7971789.1 contractile injection system protein, VgrG/Pvc8 family [Sphingomonas sp. AR_OL41]
MVDAATEAAKLAELVELAIDGKRYSVWSSVSVTRSLDSLAGTFELSLAAKDRTAGAELAINKGDKCRVMIAGEPVIDGFVDVVSLTIGSADAGITISGRDRTADLADCSAIHKPGSWKNVKLEAIASELAKPFGISVTAKTSTGKPIVKFALQQSETVQAAIERLCRFRGLLMVANATGDLEIIKPGDGAPIATLEIGVNILSATATHDASQQFSEYRIKGQAAGSDHKHGKTVAQISGSATDATVKRYRPLLIIAEDQGDGASLGERAASEAGVRRGKSLTVPISVVGWRVAAGGALWRPNVRARVKCPPVKVADQVMLVSAVTLTKSESGTTATLTCMPREAWVQLAGGKL